MDLSSRGLRRVIRGTSLEEPPRWAAGVNELTCSFPSTDYITPLQNRKHPIASKKWYFSLCFLQVFGIPIVCLWDRTGAADKGVQPPLHRSCLRSVRDWCSLSLGLWSFGSLRSLLGSLRSANSRFVWMVWVWGSNSSTKYIPYFVFWQQPKFLGCFLKKFFSHARDGHVRVLEKYLPSTNDKDSNWKNIGKCREGFAKTRRKESWSPAGKVPQVHPPKMSIWGDWGHYHPLKRR